MADIDLSNGLDGIRGKLATRDKIYFRKRNGKQTSLYQYLLTRFLREAKADRGGKVEEVMARVENQGK